MFLHILLSINLEEEISSEETSILSLIYFWLVLQRTYILLKMPLDNNFCLFHKQNQSIQSANIRWYFIIMKKDWYLPL